MFTVLVFGASASVGSFLLPLLDGHYNVIAVSRSPRPRWMVGDLNDVGRLWPTAQTVVSLGPLDAFAAWLERQEPAPRRVIALSSMSAESKRESSDQAERELAQRLCVAEARVFETGHGRGIACTIFRPTLIYGAGTDRSLAPIARFARRWRILPIPFGASGLRQPVHAADLAQACMDVIDNPATHGKTYALGGGERLRFDTMLRRLQQETPGFVLPIPLPVFALRRMTRLWRGGAIGAGALLRLRDDLIADNAAATRDFGYAPRLFLARDVLVANPAAPG
jgi:nucleoside-diphosphate-sugar epimerase